MATEPRVMAVIPTIGAAGRDELRHSVANLRGASVGVVVVANSASALRFAVEDNLPYVDAGTNLGFGAAVELAARSSEWDVLLIVNDDFPVSTDLAQSIASIVRAEYGAGGRWIAHFGPVATRMIPSALDVFLNLSLLSKVSAVMDKRLRSAADDETFDSFDCVAIPRTLWRELGGFDSEIIFAFEDADFVLRALHGGPLRRSRHASGTSAPRSVSSSRHAEKVLPVVVQSAITYLSRRGHAGWSTTAMVLLALAIRTVTGMGSRVGPLVNLRATIRAMRAALGARASLPPYEAT